MEKLVKTYLILGIIPLLAGMVSLNSYSSDLNYKSLAAGQPFTDEIENLSSVKKLQPLSYIENPYKED